MCIASCAALAGGCAKPPVAQPVQAGRADRLKRHYSDLASGRFAVIADFEDRRHLELFHIEPAGGTDPIRWIAGSGVAETGARCILFTLPGPDCTLVADNTHVAQWFMKTDWREFDLLLMQVLAPRDGLEVEVGVVAGRDESRKSVYSRLPLSRGWNSIRIDLAEVGEHVPLDDIVALEWGLPDADKPEELGLDDIILANNTKDLFGDGDGTSGELFIRRRGRRWAIGASGRFELGFGGGQVVQWYDLAGDPNRLNNLVARTVLGPGPIVVPSDDTTEANPGESDFGALGPSVVARQRVVEVSPVRVVVEADWRFVGSVPPHLDQAPFQHWRYAVYSSGNVYVDVECTTAWGNWRPTDIGLAVSRSVVGDMEFYAHHPAQLRHPGRLRHVAFAYSRSRDLAAPALLFALHDARRAPELEFIQEEDIPRATLVAFGGKVQPPNDRWMCMLNIWPPDNATGTNPADRVLDYCYPADRIHLAKGRLVTDDEGDVDRDGFNEREGFYVVAPEASQVRFELDGRKQRMFHPAFSVKESADLTAWVYVDSIMLESTGRDTHGNVLFEVPRIVDGRVTVEIYLHDAGVPESLDTPRI